MEAWICSFWEKLPFEALVKPRVERRHDHIQQLQGVLVPKPPAHLDFSGVARSVDMRAKRIAHQQTNRSIGVQHVVLS